MRSPIRKPGKFTHDKPDFHVTEEKYKALKTELEKLTKFKRPAAAIEVDRLAQHGDFSENAPYQMAKGRLRGINARITALEEYLKQVQIIKPDKHSNYVQLGSLVTVEANGKKQTYQILGSEETDPTRGIISQSSPIGAALLGKEIGNLVTIKLAKTEVKYKIIGIG